MNALLSPLNRMYTKMKAASIMMNGKATGMWTEPGMPMQTKQLIAGNGGNNRLEK
jgi:hypothetical protein